MNRYKLEESVSFDRRFGKKRRRCAFVGFLVPTFIVGQFIINVAFFDAASSFKCRQKTIVPRIAQKISQQPKARFVTSIHSVTGTNAVQVSENTPTPTPLKSIIPEGVPMQKYGTPVGAVILPGSCIESFYRECQTALPEIKNLKFRGVENHDKVGSKTIRESAEVAYKAIHVQTEVAASLLDGDSPSLVEFIHENNGYFLPGARMQRDERGIKSNPSCSETKQSSKFTFVELFAGVGGFRLGLEPLGGSCVLASEKDEMACAFYRRHFGKNAIETGCSELVEGDVLDVVSSDFPPDGFDILTAGFPCQPFSARGKKKGLEDDGHRGQMYQELVRILVKEQPPFFLFENVVGLVTMDGGRRVVPQGVSSDEKYTTQHFFEAGKTMEIVLKAFRSCGYKVEWHVVNCKDFCPQHRERVYFVGSRLDLNCPDVEWDNIYPKNEKDNHINKPLLRDFLEQDPSNCPYVKGCELTKQQWKMVQRKWGAENEAEALASVGLKIDEPSAPTLISSYKTPASLSARFVTEEADGTLRDGNALRPRFLTPIEFRRIMGFPENFEVTSPLATGDTTDGIVDGHIYKVLGNAVVPSVIEAIGREIVRLMDEVEAQTTHQEASA